MIGTFSLYSRLFMRREQRKSAIVVTQSNTTG